MGRCRAPGPLNVTGVSNIAPAIMAVGTAVQQERLLRPMLHGDEIWSQGMSDPDVARHRGITCLLVDLHLPGIEARSITTIAGDQAFAELFFDEVRVHSQITAMRWMTDRALASAERGAAPEPAAGSLAKLAWARADQALCELAVEMLGAKGMVESDRATLLASLRQTSIAGGTSEINRNIVAEHGLGLPR